MRIKKISLCFITLILLSGCQAIYDIDISSDKITDELSLIETKNENESFPSEYDIYNSAYIDDDGKEYYYNQSEIRSDNNYGIKLEYEYELDNYQNSTVLKKCYTDSSINIEQNKVTLKATGFKCLNYNDTFVEQVIINVTSENKIITSNADKKSKEKITWIINHDNVNNHSIELAIKLDEKKDQLLSASEKNSLANIICYVAIFILFILLIIFIIKSIRKNKQNNSFD